MGMKKILFPLLLFFSFISINSQVITWTPQFATANDSITVIFDATKGTGGLAGYTGDVYAHTGVITNLSSSGNDWRYVKTTWGQNTPETKLERIGTNLYRFKIKPNVRIFYGVPSNETILKVAFVFRSAAPPYKEGKDDGGKDIFLPLFQGGVSIQILSPSTYPTFHNLNDAYLIKAKTSYSDTIKLYVNNQLTAVSIFDSIVSQITLTKQGRNDFKIRVIYQGQTKDTNFYCIVKKDPQVLSQPQNTVDGINYNPSNNSVTFVLRAPNKTYAYIVGDFSNWEVKDEYQLNKTPDNIKLWITLSNLDPNYEYGFQYFVIDPNKVIRIPDPYCEKVLVEGEDQEIIQLGHYPNLKQYPTGKTTKTVGIFQINRPQYQWTATNYQRPPKEKLIIYELLIRDFINPPTYSALIDTLNYLQRLGVNAIELLPITEYEGNKSWGYNPFMMFAVDKFYGPANELKRFIDECHKRNIAVIFDIVVNHQFGRSPLVMLYNEGDYGNPTSDNPWFNVVPKHPFNVGYDLNHESAHTQYWVDRILEYWLTEFKFDGYRFDLSKGITQKYTGSDVEAWGQYDAGRIALLKRYADKIWSVDPTAYVILEHFAENNEEKELASYRANEGKGIMLWGKGTYEYNEATMGWTTNSNFSHIYYANRGWDYRHLVGFMESHDEERLMYKNLKWGNSNASIGYNVKDTATALQRMKLASAFFYTIPGPKMLWQFGELGYDYSIEYNGRTGEKPIRWDYYQDARRKRLFKVTSNLIQLKKNYNVFNAPFSFQYDFGYPVKWLKASDNTVKVYIIGNFDVISYTFNAYFDQTGWWYNHFALDSIYIDNTSSPYQIQVKPGELYFFTSKKLYPQPEPDAILNIKNEEISLNGLTYYLEQNYPNPFNPKTIIKFTLPNNENVKLRIYDSLGRLIKELFNDYLPAGIYEFEWNGTDNNNKEVGSGVYFYKLESSNFSQVKKMTLLK